MGQFFVLMYMGNLFIHIHFQQIIPQKIPMKVGHLLTEQIISTLSTSISENTLNEKSTKNV